MDTISLFLTPSSESRTNKRTRYTQHSAEQLGEEAVRRRGRLVDRKLYVVLSGSTFSRRVGIAEQ